MELVVDTSVIVAVLLEAPEKQDLVEMTRRVFASRAFIRSLGDR